MEKQDLVNWINNQLELEALEQEEKAEANKLPALIAISNLQYTNFERIESEYIHHGRLEAFNEILNLLGKEAKS